MTNEELVGLIKQGDDGLLPQLWEQVRRFVIFMANQYHQKFTNKQGCDVEDLVQAGYLGLIEAVKRYKPEAKSAFTTFLAFALKTAFAETMGVRTSKRDGLFSAISFDVPAGEDGDTTLLDMLGDMTPGTANIEDIIVENVFNQELRELLDKATRILNEMQREIIVLHYYFDLSFARISEIKEITPSYVNYHHNMALYRIYNSKYRAELECFMSALGKDFDLYKGTGYLSWKESGYSVEEAFVIRQLKSPEGGNVKNGS